MCKIMWPRTIVSHIVTQPFYILLSVSENPILVGMEVSLLTGRRHMATAGFIKWDVVFFFFFFFFGVSWPNI